MKLLPVALMVLLAVGCVQEETLSESELSNLRAASAQVRTREAARDAAAEVNRKLAIGQIVCVRLAEEEHELSPSVYRGEVSARRVEDGTVTRIRFKNLVAWGGSNHLKPFDYHYREPVAGTAEFLPEPFWQVRCQEIGIERR